MTNRGQKGMALAAALSLSAIVMMMALGYLTTLHQDTSLERRSGFQTRTLYLAQAGLRMFSFKEIEQPGVHPAGVTFGPVQVGRGEYFELTPDGRGGCVSVAWLEDGQGRRIAERTLILPGNHRAGGDWSRVYDPNL